MRQVHLAGEQLFVDYAGQTVEVVDGRDRRGAHRRRSSSPCSAPPASPTPRRPGRQTLPDWIGAHVRAFAFFGGVPRADGAATT